MPCSCPGTSNCQKSNGLPSGAGVSSSVPSDSSGAADDAIVMLRFSALTMPLVTVPERPSGAPIAMAVSPTLRSSESANSALGSPLAPSSLMTARSEIGSVPTMVGVVEAAVVRGDLDVRVGNRAIQRHDVGVGEHVAVLRQDDAGAGAAAGGCADRDRDDRGRGLRGDRGDERRVVCVVDVDDRGKVTAGDGAARVAGHRPERDTGARDAAHQCADGESRDHAHDGRALRLLRSRGRRGSAALGSAAQRGRAPHGLLVRCQAARGSYPMGWSRASRSCRCSFQSHASVALRTCALYLDRLGAYFARTLGSRGWLCMERGGGRPGARCCSARTDRSARRSSPR